jgi:hypothetical protein
MHKRFSRAVLLAACLTVLGAEVHAQPGSCVTDITLVPVLVRGTGMTLESQGLYHSLLCGSVLHPGRRSPLV